jgi:hypothetical protein
MAVYPGAIPSAGSAISSATLAAAGHTALHNTDRDEIRALATKAGTGASTPVAGTVLRGTGAGTSAWSQVNVGSDVTGVLPVGNGGTGATNEEDARENLGVNTALEILSMVYPIGSIYMNAVNATNPGTLLGFGTWVASGSGRVPVGFDSGDSDFNVGEKTGGAKTHTLTEAEMPSHTHGPGNVYNDSQLVGTGAVTRNMLSLTPAAVNQNMQIADTGSDAAHNNLQPYITYYIWKRTA